MKKLLVIALLAVTMSVIAPPTLASGGEDCPSVYIVQRGDYLSRIARFFRVPLNVVLQMNDFMGNPNLIHPGDKVNLPCAGGPTNQAIPAAKPQPQAQPAPVFPNRIELNGVYRGMSLPPRSSLELGFDNIGDVTITLKNGGRNVTFYIQSPSVRGQTDNRGRPKNIGIGEPCKPQHGDCSQIWRGGGPERGTWWVVVENWENYPAQVLIGAIGQVPSCGEGTEKRGIIENFPNDPPGTPPSHYWVMCYPKQ